nr:DNA-binding pseudobarrel domain-containing protein [Tanacetum cinerariifolium]
MTIQFIVEANQRNIQTEQVLPNLFTKTLYTGCLWLYLIHNIGTKHKVWLKKVSGTNNYALFSHEWKAFLSDSIYVRVSTLHFIREGEDEYYVTTYHNGGIKCNGYDFVRILPYQFLPNLKHNQAAVMGWNILAEVENLEVGTKMIFTNLLNNTVLLVPFDDSGIALRLENVPRMPLNQQRSFVKSPCDKELDDNESTDIKKQNHQCGKEEEKLAIITTDMKHAVNDDKPDEYYYEMEAEEQKQWKLESEREARLEAPRKQRKELEAIQSLKK